LKFNALYGICLCLFAASANARVVEGFKEDSTQRELIIESGQFRMFGVHWINYQTPISAEKDYTALSEEERARWRNLNYENMPESDVPPFPQGGLHALLGPIAAKNMDDELNGTVKVLVEIAPDGSPRKAEVYAAPSAAFGNYVMQVMLKNKFTPASCAGRPCAMVLPLEILLKYQRR